MASGSFALTMNTTGRNNIASGFQALTMNTTGSNNLAFGEGALVNDTGSSNVALGTSAGFSVTTGSNNIDVANVGEFGDEHVIRIGTQGTQTRAFMAGVYKTILPFKAKTCIVKVTEKGQLGCSVAKKEGEETRARIAKQQHEINRQQQEISQLASELKSLRAAIRTHR